MRRASPLPANLPPRGVRVEVAAAYVGVSATTFQKWVADGRMPGPKRVDGVVMWDRLALDTAFDALSDGVASDWDQVRAS